MPAETPDSSVSGSAGRSWTPAKSPVAKSVEGLLLTAAEAVTPSVSGDEPWDYGWCVPEYRRSPRASLTSPDGPVSLAGDGVEAYEQAVERLLREGAIKDRWHPEDLWWLVAQMVVAAARSPDPKSSITAGLEHLRRARRVSVLVPVANVTWGAAPLRLGDGVVGMAGDGLVTELDGLAQPGEPAALEAAREWSRAQQQPDGMGSATRQVVVAGFSTRAQGRLAVDRAKAWVEDLCALALLSVDDPGALGLYSLRGSANRPGLRGLTLERSAVQRAFEATQGGRHEMSVEPFVLSDTGAHAHGGAFSVDPVDLYALLADGSRKDFVLACLTSTDVIPRRLRVAARWYADAHWSLEEDDAVLALGVALDALVGARQGLPGRILAQRFAYLEPDPTLRRARVDRWNEMYSLRSTIAHGGEAGRALEAFSVRDMAAEVVWTAKRLRAFDAQFHVRSEADFEAVGERLRLGEVSWRQVVQQGGQVDDGAGAGNEPAESGPCSSPGPV
ncbi:MAG: hypothetical protein JWO67_6780 [Streptosporangiaceae bacterium]|nr:hypothetical protein [Streptosporangiaceae bacterium]